MNTTHETSLITLDPVDTTPTVYEFMEASFHYFTHNKEYDKECICLGCMGRADSSACTALWDNMAHQRKIIDKGRAMMMQNVRPMGPTETEDTNPVPWKSHDTGSAHRGPCLLYLPATFPSTARTTPFCLLHENDVVDNGTTMCLRALTFTNSFRLDNTCFYGNETMKAILGFHDRQENAYATTSWIYPVFFILLVLLMTILKRFMGGHESSEDVSHKPTSRGKRVVPTPVAREGDARFTFAYGK